jgi:excisionase family DNA binding protein
MKLTINDVVKKLEGKIAKSTLYEAVEQKRIAHYRISGTGRRGKILIDEADLEAWLEEQRVGAQGTGTATTTRRVPKTKLVLNHLQLD